MCKYAMPSKDAGNRSKKSKKEFFKTLGFLYKDKKVL